MEDFNLVQLRLHALDDVERILPVAHDHNPANGIAVAVEIGNAAPDLRPERDLGHVAQQHRRAGLGCLDGNQAEIIGGFHITAPAHHEFLAVPLDEAAADLVVAAFDGVHDFHDANAVGLQFHRIDRYLILLLEPAQPRDFGDARYALQRVAQHPILITPQIREAVCAGLVHQRVLINPAHARRVGTEFGCDARRQLAGDLRKVLVHPTARPVQIGAVLENHVHVRKPKIAGTADGLHARRAEQRGDDRIGDLVFHDVRAAVPLRKHDDLRVAEIGDRIQPDILHRIE